MGLVRATVAFLAKRIVAAAAVLWIVAFLTYGLIRWLRPEQYPGQHYWPGLWHDISQAFFHWNWGPGCSANPNCLGVQIYWERGWVSDVVLLGGGILLGICGGIACGLWCARHPRTLRARSLEALAMLAFCAPVYVVALGLLLAFNPDFGALGIPFFFDANPHQYDTIAHPLEWLRAYALPWTVLALPIGGAITRTMVAMIREELGADHIRTAIAKGVSARLVMRRHAAPGVYPSVASLVWGLVPLIVTNAVLIEYTLNVPGFFLRFRAASGKYEAPAGHHLPTIDVPMLSGIALWTCACILFLTLLADLALLLMDPRVRTPAG
jgi:peptide/nickel transport system permease protein